MDNKTLFEESLVYLDVDFDTSEDFLEFIGNELENTNLTKGGFKKALLIRESKYPTGLPTIPIPVAIPHCDPKYVNEERIVCVRFKKPIVFVEMGTLDKFVEVEYAFVLLMKGVKQISVLQKLMPLFMNAEFMNSLKHIKSKKEYKEKVEGMYYET